MTSVTEPQIAAARNTVPVSASMLEMRTSRSFRWRCHTIRWKLVGAMKNADASAAERKVA